MMRSKEQSFFRSVCALAIPVALQSMLQTSFGVVDQVMIGQLGGVAVAAVGLAGKFTGIFHVVISAVGAVAGIMISQYMGQKNTAETRRSMFLNLRVCLILAVLFMLAGITIPEQIMGLYIADTATAETAGQYLLIVSGTFLPATGITILSTYLRCMEKASLPLYAGITSAAVNTGLNWILIFGKFGAPALGIRGAALATLISQFIYFAVIFVMYLKYQESTENHPAGSFAWKQYLSMLLPLLVSEFMWVLGENVYAGIYGHLGTAASAAMTLTNPVQSLAIGALCGLSQAAAILMGKRLGDGDRETAYREAKKLLLYGLAGSLLLSVVIFFISHWYVRIFNVETHIRELTVQILAAYAAVMPFKVLNMIIGSGILRSGGKTTYVMVIDLVGTWLLGVPLGFLTAFVLGWPIPMVYLTLSMEECIRFAVSLIVFKRRGWMNQLKVCSRCFLQFFLTSA